jgi:nucleotide-binding universal stress UspA family protein
VVGVDGSPASWQAIHAAAWEAGHRGRRLVLAHGYPADPYTWFGWAPAYAGPAFDPHMAAQALVDETADEVRQAYPELTVDTELFVGPGAHALIAASDRAVLVVVGARGRGGFSGLGIGSVAAQTAAHARSPVLVVRPIDGVADDAAVVDTGVHSGSVVVGVDGSPGSDIAIAFAFEEAMLRQVPLEAVYVWWLLPQHALGPDLPAHVTAEQAQEESRRMLAELMAGWTGKYPDVPVRLRAVQAMNPSQELIEASREAGLVVVGSRGRGGFAGLLLGSVSRDLVGHAYCPVAVVHPRTPR